jgi:hydroxymethylbilane synthase
MAGVKRLGRVNDVKFVELDAHDFIPSGGQGALAIETLADSDAADLASAINDPRAFYETAAERAFLAAIGASCTTPVGVRATMPTDPLRAGTLVVGAMLFSPDGARELVDAIIEPLDPNLAPSAAENSGQRLAEKMLARGAAAILGK